MIRCAFLFFFTFLFFQNIQAQEGVINLVNPSFEGVSMMGEVGGHLPEGWIFSGTPGEAVPDVYPLNYSIDKRKSFPSIPHGNSCLGMTVRANGFVDCISQRLEKPLKRGTEYSFRIQLASLSYYKRLSIQFSGQRVRSHVCRLRIWGGHNQFEKKELLAESKLVASTVWVLYDFTLAPSADYGYIFFEAFYENPEDEPYNGNIIMDDASPIVPLKKPEELIWHKDEELNRFEYEDSIMGNEIKVTFYAYKEKFADEVADNLFSFGKNLQIEFMQSLENELTKLTGYKGRKKYIHMENESFKLLRMGLGLTRRYEGSYDVTAGRSKMVWKRAFKKNKLPQKNEVNLAMGLRGYENIEFKGLDEIRIKKTGIQFNLGRLPQAYIAEKIMNKLSSYHIARARINFGEDIIMLSQAPPNEEGWGISINGEKMKLSNVSIARSGYNEVSKEIGGQVYFSFFNPKTGLGCTHRREVTIIGKQIIYNMGLAEAQRVGLPEHYIDGFKKSNIKIISVDY